MLDQTSAQSTLGSFLRTPDESVGAEPRQIEIEVCGEKLLECKLIPAIPERSEGWAPPKPMSMSSSLIGPVREAGSMASVSSLMVLGRGGGDRDFA